MITRLRSQDGLAMLSVLAVILVLTIISATVLYLSGKELGLTAVRMLGAQSISIAEGGAFSGRSALMALMNADPIGVATLDASLSATTLADLYAGGTAGNQNPFGLFDYITVDGERFTLGATNATNSVTFDINWGLATPHRKLQVPTGIMPANPLGGGSYTANVVIARRMAAHPVDNTEPQRFVQQLGIDFYEYFFTATITADGTMPAESRRRVVLTRDFSVRVRRQSFAQYALFTNVHTMTNGSAIWFTGSSGYDGPVHTNGQFRFAYFSRFGTPDTGSPCDPADIAPTTLTSVSTTAVFNNNGSSVTLSANENVVGGVRRDAPVLPDCTPGSTADDNDNPPANFTRGVSAIPFPTNSFSQQGIAVGRNPSDATAVTNLQIRQSIPELADNTSAVPGGIYVPVTDANSNGVSDDGEGLGGGIYVEGDLDSLTMSTGGAGNSLAIYTMVRGTQTVTVTVDRVNQTTTVTNTAWASPQTRSFAGVPKGWQGPGNAHAGLIYVNGSINSLGGTLEEKEQTTIAASGRIDITNHIRYEDPPDVTDPNDNPLNVLGLYSSNNEIRIRSTAPNDIDLHAVMMAGNTSDGFNSQVWYENWNTGGPRGTSHLIGGVIEEYYGPFFQFNSSGDLVNGYARDFKYDRRMSRGFTPPFFPSTNLFVMDVGSQPLAGVRPVWREATP
jgi:hypothetical protein